MSGRQWAPIPDHAIDVPMGDGRSYPVLPERLVEVEGRQYVRCELHGLIPADHQCGASPSDHLCAVAGHPNHVPGEPHDDQCTPHAEWANHLLDRINAVIRLHHPDTDGSGGNSGGCAECGLGWPCLTFHVARGWGDLHDCLDAGWCHHAEVPMDPAEHGYLDLPAASPSRGGHREGERADG